MIRKAKLSEIEYLSELALRSKSHWGYDSVYLEKCRPIIKIDKEYFENWPVVVYEQGSKPLGFYTLKIISNENRLDNLWVEPEVIGSGFGTKLFLHSIEVAKSLAWNYFRLASEPKAVKFYEKMGAVQIGELKSLLEPKFLLPHIEMKF